jgi:UDP:flavonoid glycosyltransferase YjiC (YdhE family)
MKNQHEQHFNAASLKELGVPVIKKVNKKNLSKIEAWINNTRRVEVNYPETADPAIARLMEMYAEQKK